MLIKNLLAKTKEEEMKEWVNKFSKFIVDQKLVPLKFKQVLLVLRIRLFLQKNKRHQLSRRRQKKKVNSKTKKQ